MLLYSIALLIPTTVSAVDLCRFSVHSLDTALSSRRDYSFFVLRLFFLSNRINVAISLNNMKKKVLYRRKNYTRNLSFKRTAHTTAVSEWLSDFHPIFLRAEFHRTRDALLSSKLATHKKDDGEIPFGGEECRPRLRR